MGWIIVNKVLRKVGRNFRCFWFGVRSGILVYGLSYRDI